MTLHATREVGAAAGVMSEPLRGQKLGLTEGVEAIRVATALGFSGGKGDPLRRLRASLNTGSTGCPRPSPTSTTHDGVRGRDGMTWEEDRVDPIDVEFGSRLTTTRNEGLGAANGVCGEDGGEAIED